MSISSYYNRQHLGYSSRSTSLQAWVLLLLFLFSAACIFFRIYHSDYGIHGGHVFQDQPVKSFHPDEWGIKYMTEQIYYSQNPFNIGGFYKYGTLKPLLAAVLLSFRKVVLGSTNNAVDFYRVLRFISFVCSVLTLWVVFAIGRRWSMAAALFSAAFYCVSMVSAREAHWAGPDPLCALMVAAAVLYGLKALERPVLSNFIIIGLFIAMAVGAKIYCLGFLHVPLLAFLLSGDDKLLHGGRSKKRFILQDRRVIIPLLVMGIISFLNTGIYILLDIKGFYDSLMLNYKWTQWGSMGILPRYTRAPHYFSHLLPEAVGWPIYLLALAGIFFQTFIQRDRKSLLIIGSISLFWIFLEINRITTHRYSLPIITFIAVFAGIFLARLLELTRQKYIRLGIWGIAGVVFVYSTLYTWAFISRIDQQNGSRLSCANWIVNNIPAGTKLGIPKWNSCRWSYLPSDNLKGYRYGSFLDSLDYFILPALPRLAMETYFKSQEIGYNYEMEDWWPSGIPSPELIDLYRDILAEKGYRLLKIFGSQPSMLGTPIKFFSWETEIISPEIRIYQRLQPMNEEGV